MVLEIGNCIKEDESWDLIIKPKSGWFDIHFRELMQSADLISLFVRRDFVTFYKQTILGPLWYLIQPLFMTLMFTIIFGKFAKISTDGTPHILFYMSGTIVWRYYAECLGKTSNTFIANSEIFGKVYFPRLTVPISVVLTNFIQFFIQFALFLCIYTYYIIQGSPFQIGYGVLYIPMILMEMALLGIGFGILISSVTTKYRDLIFTMPFFIQLWMYATPIVYPLSMIPEKYQTLYCINPMVPIVECFRLAFFGASAIQVEQILTGWAVTIFILLLGIMLFSRVEKTFMDTV